MEKDGVGHVWGDTHPYDPGLKECEVCGLIIETGRGMENEFPCDFRAREGGR